MGSEMCIRDRQMPEDLATQGLNYATDDQISFECLYESKDSRMNKVNFEIITASEKVNEK